jgi:hypothetical protein
LELALRPLLGKTLAKNPRTKMPTRMAISVISTVFVMWFPALSTGRNLVVRD